MGVLKRFLSRASEFFDNICEDSTVQGLRFVGSVRSRPIERIFWIISIASCLGYSIYLIHGLYQRYKAVPVIVSFQPEETSIQQILFPAITICNVNMYKASVMNKLVDEFYNVTSSLPDPFKSPEYFKYAFMVEQLLQYCLQTPSFRRRTQSTLCDATGRIDFVAVLQDQYIQVDTKVWTKFLFHVESAINKTLETYQKAAMNCEDMILRCSWNSVEIPCNEVFFSVETDHGRCCAFNMMPKFIMQRLAEKDRRAINERKQTPASIIRAWETFSFNDIVRDKDNLSESEFPKYQSSGGLPYGLSLVVNPDLKEYSTCTTNDGEGFTLEAHSPVSVPSISEYGVAIPARSEVFVEIDPFVTKADFDVMKSMKISSRECFLPIDRGAKLEIFNIYTAANCYAECISYYTFRTCGCVPYHMPRVSLHPTCGAKQRQCAHDVFDTITLGYRDQDYCAKCRPACTEIEYKTTVNSFGLADNVLKSPFAYRGSDGEKKNATDISIIHIYFGTDTLYIKERKPLYDLGTLIGDCGSLFGFTLGISLVSFLEFIYWFTLRLFFFCRSKLRKRNTDLESANLGTGNTVMRFDPYGKVRFYRNHSLKTKKNRKRSGRVILYPFLK